MLRDIIPRFRREGGCRFWQRIWGRGKCCATDADACLARGPSGTKRTRIGKRRLARAPRCALSAGRWGAVVPRRSSRCLACDALFLARISSADNVQVSRKCRKVSAVSSFASLAGWPAGFLKPWAPPAADETGRFRIGSNTRQLPVKKTNYEPPAVTVQCLHCGSAGCHAGFSAVSFRGRQAA